MSDAASTASSERRTGCGLLNAVFGAKKFWPRRTTSTGSLPSQNGSCSTSTASSINGGPTKIPSAGHNSKRRRGSFDDLESALSPPPPRPASPKLPLRNQQQQQQKQPQQKQQPQQQQQRRQQETSMVAAAASRSVQLSTKKTTTVPKESLGISGELESMLAEQQRSRGGANLVRVSSGNVMVHSSLGNLRQSGGIAFKPNNNDKMNNININNNNNNNNISYASKYANSGIGNIVNKKQLQPQPQPQTKTQQNGGKMIEASTSLCRALSCRMDPEELKIMGNEDYKNGRFAEALALYERAIDLDPTKASYRSNKSAALTALGRLLEAVFECREAIVIEPTYQRAHQRLASLYLRLGESEKAMYHFKQAGPDADPDTLSKAKAVLGHLKKCDEAKRLKDWNTVLRESGNAIGAGADSALMIFALQAEAYLKLHKHQDAYATLTNSPYFDADECTKFLGPVAYATLLVIRAQVDMVAGRFDEAMEAVQRASKLDPSNREVSIVSRRARAVSSARSNGNELFKESRYSEACVAYGQGLEHDPFNSVLLCNRATCRAKLGQFDKAIEDCTSALNVRPLYTKARLRRADCYVKLGKWEAAIRDYETMLQESPGDEDVGKAMFDAQVQLKKQRGEDVSNLKFGNDGVVKVQSNEHFRSLTSWPGLSVAWFSNKRGDKQTSQLMEQLSKTYPTIKFLKVDCEDNQSLVKAEGCSTLPAFKLYRSGSRVKEVPGEDHEALESSIKDQTS